VNVIAGNVKKTSGKNDHIGWQGIHFFEEAIGSPFFFHFSFFGQSQQCMLFVTRSTEIRNMSKLICSYGYMDPTKNRRPREKDNLESRTGSWLSILG
jgi:hypothetical protein